jgi:hypothetical protein
MLKIAVSASLEPLEPWIGLRSALGTGFLLKDTQKDSHAIRGVITLELHDCLYPLE